MSGPVTAPTRAAVLQLQDEQKVVNEAYTFLDEKRLVLASELLRQLKLYKAHQHELEGMGSKGFRFIPRCIRMRISSSLVSITLWV